MENLAGVLAAAGSGLERVLRTTVYLQRMDDFTRMNAVYGTFFPKDPPARATIEAARLPRGALVEIDCIAALQGGG
jgi:2-iminobutanoate/2-iminopropanoate deaminase